MNWFGLAICLTIAQWLQLQLCNCLCEFASVLIVSWFCMINWVFLLAAPFWGHQSKLSSYILCPAAFSVCMSKPYVIPGLTTILLIFPFNLAASLLSQITPDACVHPLKCCLRSLLHPSGALFIDSSALSLCGYHSFPFHPCSWKHAPAHVSIPQASFRSAKLCLAVWTKGLQ